MQATIAFLGFCIWVVVQSPNANGLVLSSDGTPRAECPKEVVTAIENDQAQALQDALVGREDLRDCCVSFRATRVWDGKAEAVTRILGKPEVQGTALHLATDLDHAGIVKLLVKNNFNPNALAITKKDKRSSTPLMFAAWSGYEKVVEELLATPGINVNEQNPDGRTALMMAAYRGRLEVVELLLRKLAGAPGVNIQDRDQASALMYAAKNADQEVLNALVNAENIDLNLQDEDLRTALMYAVIFKGVPEVATILHAPGVDCSLLNEAGQTALMLAAQVRRLKSEMFTLFLQKESYGVNIPDKGGFTLLMKVLRDSSHIDLQFVKQLLGAEGFNVNLQDPEGHSVLMMAAGSGNLEVLDAILDVDAVDVSLRDKDGMSVLMMASRKNNKEVVERLVNVPSLTDEDKTISLLLAAEGNAVQVVPALVASDIDVNVQREDGMSALMLAATNGFAEVIEQLLVDERLDLNMQNQDGMTALMLAARKNHGQVVHMLMSAKGVPAIHPDLTNSDGMSALMVASESNAEEVVSVLVGFKIDANLQRQDGLSALMLAAMKGHAKVVEKLLEYKQLDVNLKDKEDNTALMLAAKRDYVPVIQKLKNAQGVDVEVRNKDGVNALVLAAENSDDSASAFLNDLRGIDEHAAHSAVLNGLMMAAESGHQKALENFLKFRNIDLDSHTDEGDSVLMRAVAGGQRPMATLLLEMKQFDLQYRSKAGKTLLHHAVLAKQHGVDMVRFVLGLCKSLLNDITKDRQTALQMAVRRGDIGLVQVLLQHGAAVRHKDQGKNSALRIALQIGDSAIIRLLMAEGASSERDVVADDEEGKKLAVWFGVKFSLMPLVEHFAWIAGDPWRELWIPPSRCQGDIQDVKVGDNLLALAQTTSMVHLLFNWQQSQEKLTDFDDASVTAQQALEAAFRSNNEVVASALLARGVALPAEVDSSDLAQSAQTAEMLTNMKDWNRFHWSARSCDLEAMTNAFTDADQDKILLLLQQKNKDNQTPVQIAKRKCTQSRAFSGVLQQYQDLAMSRQKEREWRERQQEADKKSWVKRQWFRLLVSIVAVITCVGTLTLHLFFLRLQTLQKHGWWISSMLPMSLVLVGALIAWKQDLAWRSISREQGNELEDVQVSVTYNFMWVGLVTAVSGAVLFSTMCLAFQGGGFARFLLWIKRVGNVRLERCWEKMDVFLAAFLLLAVTVKELLVGGRGIALILGTANVVASALPLCTATPRRIALPLRSIAGTIAVIFGYWFPDGSAAVPLFPAELLIGATFLALAWADMPGAVISVTEAVAKASEIEMCERSDSQAGKFTSNKLVLGRSELAARGIEYALGLKPEGIALGLQDPIAAMEKEVKATGDINDWENFQYIVYGESGCTSDYPSAVTRSLEIGKYHGGTLGSDDFDTGHSGRTLQDWMKLREVDLAGLTEAEFVAVRFYTSSSYWRINNPLRQEVRPHPWAMVVYLLDRGIKKLRSVQAQVDPRAFAGQTTLWRGMKDREVDVGEFGAVGGTEMAPMSTTTSEAVARHYAESKAPLLFKYVVGGLKTGVAIQFLSLYPKEEEFLYAPLTFLSLKRRYEDDGVIVLVVEPVMS